MDDFTFERHRIFAFTDAVFSIAITLLILDISLPNNYVESSKSSMVLLESLIPNFMGFIISFLVIARYWKFYLTYSRFADKFTDRLFWLNIYLLFSIVLLPFSTSFFVGGFYEDVRFIFYVSNLILLSTINYIMLLSILKSTSQKIKPITQKWLKFRAFNSVFVWTFALLLSFVFPVFARFFFVFLFIFQAIGKKIIFRKKKKLTRI
ncbi:putative integral membrane protein [Aequorivita sublithincola DSM 14238]|uniref:Putative integral membrane protein n=1 Tax=Aequorivita sublithincola (strain DSM 14238 / LMG 21431 / ACAM 643 / 9-3) TaxID=746697 RepID=I3YUX1_AEQSU|nr:putative integral membrane protein [Aequorivita sublithincola DSM 14238]